MESKKLKNDYDLVREVQDFKDTDSFGELYDRYVHMVYNKCYSFLGDEQNAQDLTHDVFIKAFVRIRTFDAKSKFSTWLYSLAVNHCIDYSRKKTIQTINIDDGILNSAVDAETAEDSIFEIKAENLKKILEMIEPDEKMILLLKYQDDKSVNEIAELFSIGKSAVKMRLSRARQKVVYLYNQKHKIKS